MRLYILPGFVDAHIHIESSMLPPAEFGRIALAHGTVATVSDPHEIANVLGVPGIELMLREATHTALKIHFGAPPCVPATRFETAGATVSAADVAHLLQRPDIWFLSEVMNYPGVLGGDADLLAKIEAAKQAGKPVDGHAPGLTGEAAVSYAHAGISTDHECTTLAEALGKVAAGMHILIREGSAAKNYAALAPLLALHPERVMFCSDDKHPDDLLAGHINLLAARAMADGYDRFAVLRAACLNPVRHYGLPVGLLQTGHPADFIVVDSLTHLRVQAVYIAGSYVAQDGVAQHTNAQLGEAQHNMQPQTHRPAQVLNAFAAAPIAQAALALPNGTYPANIILPADGQLTTTRHVQEVHIAQGELAAGQGLCKIAVVNRYRNAAPAVGIIAGFGLAGAAIASSVAHDSHNIVAVGGTDDALLAAINAVVDAKGGLAFADAQGTHTLPLPIAGLMANVPAQEVAAAYAKLTALAKAAGCPLHAPYMTLSFMALLVIPALKMSDLGLFDGEAFAFLPLQA